MIDVYKNLLRFSDSAHSQKKMVFAKVSRHRFPLSHAKLLPPCFSSSGIYLSRSCLLFFYYLFFFCYLFLDPPGGMSKQKKSFTLSNPPWWTGRDLNPRPFGHPRQNAYANRTFYGLTLVSIPG